MGYPDRLAAEDIPLAATFVAIARRLRRLAPPGAPRAGPVHVAAIEVMTQSSTGQFDPTLLQVFQTCRRHGASLQKPSRLTRLRLSVLQCTAERIDTSRKKEETHGAAEGSAGDRQRQGAGWGSMSPRRWRSVATRWRFIIAAPGPMPMPPSLSSDRKAFTPSRCKRTERRKAVSVMMETVLDRVRPARRAGDEARPTGAAQKSEDVTAADLRHFFEINTLGTFLCAEQAGLAMVKQKEGGSIITIGDWATRRPLSRFCRLFPLQRGPSRP